MCVHSVLLNTISGTPWGNFFRFGIKDKLIRIQRSQRSLWPDKSRILYYLTWTGIWLRTPLFKRSHLLIRHGSLVHFRNTIAHILLSMLFLQWRPSLVKVELIKLRECPAESRSVMVAQTASVPGSLYRHHVTHWYRQMDKMAGCWCVWACVCVHIFCQNQEECCGYSWPINEISILFLPQIMGGTEPTLYRGSVWYTPIVEEWYYQVEVLKLEVGNQNLDLDCREVNFKLCIASLIISNRWTLPPSPSRD